MAGACWTSVVLFGCLFVCFMGRTLPESTSVPVSCQPGYHYLSARGLCLPCPSGSYKEGDGPGPCIQCPPDADGVAGATRGSAAATLDSCFFRPYIISFEPTFGPLAGGTAVCIMLGYLENRVVTRIDVADIECAIMESYREENILWCETGPSPTRGTGQLEIQMRDPESEFILFSGVNDTFAYRPNPRVTGIENNATIISGGLALVVRGEAFDSVAHPFLEITRIYKGNATLFVSECRVLDASVMECPVPDLSSGLTEEELQSLVAQLSDSTVGSASAGSFIRRKRGTGGVPVNSPDLQFFLGFRFDGVSMQSNLTTLTVYADPVYERFEEPQFVRSVDPTEDALLHIQGERLDYVSTIDDVRVAIGDGTCDVIELYTNLLVCQLPEQEPGPGALGMGPADSLYVTVYVGTLSFVVGFVAYPQDGPWGSLTALIVSLVSIFCVWVVVAWLVTNLCWPNSRRRSKRKTNRLASESSGAEESIFVTDASDGASGASSMLTQVTDVLELLDEALQDQVKDCLLEAHTLTLGHEIGSGSFGRVCLGGLRDPACAEESEMVVAVKTLKDGTLLSAAELALFLEEAMVMKGFCHPHILPLLGVVILDNIPLVVSEYMDLGDLRSYVSEEPQVLESRTVLQICLQVAQGMVYLSSQDFVHRDLAARNCLINREGIVKIGDFGLSRELYGCAYYQVSENGRPLPVKWMAPESLNYGRFTTKSDVWSFGVLLWEVCSRGETPYGDIHNMELKSHINQGQRLQAPTGTAPEICAVMDSCWQADPQQRPSFQHLADSIRTLGAQYSGN